MNLLLIIMILRGRNRVLNLYRTRPGYPERADIKRVLFKNLDSYRKKKNEYKQ